MSPHRSILIKDTTREQREEIIRRSLAGCGDGSCEMCSSCSLGAGDPFAMYQPYIDGDMEIRDINAKRAADNERLFGLQRG
ncbi:hypothetical protein Corgl_0957 [Coriobacterium glomerans PW2]|uniref:Uncharacterized protein n=1 Tax=Coriobacterium glomerans (strain ATCC 49209 / DSM 20642 / JCM 10262 / PW2) TaxID=700015 RepID=F2N7V6_CORGP|nr:hypothetical protein [Coriobacterium glomerans]AEB07065.1 hypothetical protein Corgl_0957 [Coriobacterium glomerans PW2]